MENKKYQINYRKTHKKEAKEYRLLHKKETKNYIRSYYLKNKIKLAKYQKNYKKKHKKERIKYLENNKNKIIKQYKIYRIKHIIKINKYERKYRITKLRNDINFRIRCNLSSRLCKSIRRNTKSESTMILIGCSIDQLKQYLQSKFKSGMSWKNYGKWHIDHIKPCASFDLSKKSEQIKCFNYSNLQPLWAKDNLKKGIKQSKKGD